MKRVLLLVCLFLPLLSSAQSVVNYSYDYAGNRISRSWSRSGVFVSQSPDSLRPVFVPASIDSLSIEEGAEIEKSFDLAGGVPIATRRLPLTSYSVGSIPLQEGVSLTGARTYSLSIPTAAGFKLVPTVSLGYNSQSAEGWAGYGWDIQGISCIRLINKNEYYHGAIKAADVKSTDPFFALDGVPLVTNEHTETSSAYPLETARGHILAAPEYNSYGRVCKFTVLFSNGTRAVYGRSHNYNYHLVFYQLSQLEDKEGNRITFSYTIDSVAGHDCLSSIRYGYNGPDLYSGEIVFTYTNWTDCPQRYFAGKTIKFSKRLTSVESRSDGEVLATYNFTYQQTGPLWLLNQIDCSSGAASLPPVEFTYTTVPSSQYLDKDASTIELPASFYSQFFPNIYKRGKFLEQEYRDGILIYPGFPTYERVWNSTYQTWVYGAFAPEEQQIIFIPRLENNLYFNISLEFESGFQTIDAADVDGDGVDEIVKINIWESLGYWTRIIITTYKSSDSGYPFRSSSFFVNLNGGTVDNFPYFHRFYWGDFNGDGKKDLLAVAPNKNIGGNYGLDQTCYTAIIDMSSQSVLSDEYLFDFPYDNGNCIIAIDLDNDGRTELCYADTDGFKIYRLQQNGHFALEKTLSGPTASVMSSTTRPCYLADFNGDGYLDIARSPSTNTSSSWTIYYYNGSSFTSRSVSIATPVSFSKAMFMDVNRDGMADMVAIKQTSATTAALGTYINSNGYTFGSYQLSPSSIPDADGIVPVNISAYNHPSAFMKFDGLTVYNYSYHGLSSSSRHISRVYDSYGRIHSSSYTYLPGRAQVWRDTSLTVNTSQGFCFCTLPISVLSSGCNYMTASYTGAYSIMEYEYYNGVAHNRGLGFCGFSRIRAKDKLAPASYMPYFVADTYYLPEKMGVVNKVVRKKGAAAGDPAYYTLTNSWDSHTTTYGKLNPRLSQATSVDALTGITVKTDYYYDSWDYPTETQTTKSLTGRPTQRERMKRTYQHSSAPTLYVLGNITNESRWQDLDGQTARQWKEKSVFTLDTLFRPTMGQFYKGVSRSPAAYPFIESADSTLLVSQTRWTYDSHGNVTSELSAPYGATEFTGHTCTYDSNGRYLITDTDALGHTTTYVEYNKFGKPYRVDDHLSRNTYYSYDAWGNVTTIRHIDGSVEYTTLTWGGEGLYTVTKTEAYGGPESISHYDGLDREIRSGTKRFDGVWQYEDTEYDLYGLVKRTSLPFRGAGPSYWNTYSYDGYNRPTRILEASGKETTWFYSGTSVTSVKDGITSVATKDASGNVKSVTDAGGTIAYTLRDDGQPSAATLTPSGTGTTNITTTFTYDSYGRRTGITDPSAGTRSYTYLWNSDGSSEQTQTSANGSRTTLRDKYGRITAILCPGEFNTAYTYNTYGLLSSELSTNGTGVEYTYDNYDRVSTVKESVPDGKWFKKTYTYGSWGNVTSTKYTTQDGDITTETNSYANGRNSGVSITGGTTVWSLVSENDLGAPTEITTGTISREYGFTDYGMPTYRKMAGGSLQNFSYQFTVNNGNLYSRTDVLNSRTETFSYDNLGRLTSMQGRIIGYANTGNILSISEAGAMAYGNMDSPYRVTALSPYQSSLVPDRLQTVTYNSQDRPSQLSEGGKTASFTYNGAGDRVKMQVITPSSSELTRWYISDRYERDSTATGTTERLYLGGDAYTAPMVLRRVNNGNWTAYNIGRDYLGNITQIATVGGTLVAEYSYDPWGRLRNPATHAVYTPGTEPDLFLGRGFTGHEHLTWFGLINMNARLYDPLLGRFLSPDPYVQAPDFTQNFNRYSYALNNPLKYTDVTGEFFIIDSFIAGIFSGDWEKAKQMTWNDIKIWGGLFSVDQNNGFWERIGELLSRFTLQLPQTILGFSASQLANYGGFVDDVDYLHGATVIKTYDYWGGITMGSFIIGDQSIIAADENPLFQHEFGHYLQGQEEGWLWTLDYGLPSLINALHANYYEHNAFYAEQDANMRSFLYLSKQYGSKYANEKWNFNSNPIIAFNNYGASEDVAYQNVPLTVELTRFSLESLFSEETLESITGIQSVFPPYSPSFNFFRFII